MKLRNILPVVLAIAALSSCSVYRSGQTPDDVYYSPGKKIYVSDAVDRYESYPSSSDDAYLRMKVKDHDKWNTIDDYDYWYDSRYYANNYYSPYSSSLSIGIGYSTFYPYYSYSAFWYNPWHSTYNPYYTVVYYKNPAVYYKPVSKYNLSTYNNRNYNNYNMPLQHSNRSNMYNNTNGNNARSTNYNQTNNSNSSRTYNSGSSSSMSSGGGGGSRISGGGTRTRP